ncbi:MAG: putative protein tyrosine phosphatase [Bradymonadia bacterium]|jgi:predicted protein tyrosine phosphatase
MTAMLSIRNPDDAPLDRSSLPELPFCELRFLDTNRDVEQGPTLAEVAKGVTWLKARVLEQNSVVVLHCTEGISRSTAFAAIGLYLFGLDQQMVFRRLADHVEHLSPAPNAAVLEIADELLGSNLSRAYANGMSGAYRMWELCNA